MKKEIKRFLLGVFILLFAFIFKINSINAASCKIGVSAPSNVTVGQTFKVTVSVSSSSSLGSWEYTLSYDSSLVRLNSGTLHVVDYGNGSKTSQSYTYSFTSLNSGETSFKPVNASVLDYDTTNECLQAQSGATVSIKTQAQIEASYSKNNNLSSLSIEGASISPEFSSNIVDYTATLPVDTTKAKILATAQDKNASITGAGEVDVVDGKNRLEITVTAENGDKKTYIINLTVEELDPVVVKVNGKKYTIVRKKGQVENIPVGFVEKTIKIDNQDVIAYKSDIVNLTLVALKDDNGNTKLYIYDSKKKTYTSFEEVKSAESNLLILNDKIKVPEGFIKTKFKCNKKEIIGYNFKENKNFYLVYAKNLETGEKGFYLYDYKEGTFQRYYDDIVKEKDKQIKYLFYAALILFGLIVIKIVFKILGKIFISKERKIKKYEKKIKKLNRKFNKEYYDEEQEEIEDSYSIESIKSDKPEIKKIESKEYVRPQRSRKEKLEELQKEKDRIDNDKKKRYKRISLDDLDE